MCRRMSELKLRITKGAQLDFAVARELLITHSGMSGDGGLLNENVGFSTEVRFPIIFDDLGAPLEVVRWLENQAESGWAIVTQISTPMLDIAWFGELQGYLESKARWLSTRGAKMNTVFSQGIYVVAIAGLTRNDCTIEDIERQESLLQGFFSKIRAESPIGPNIYVAYRTSGDKTLNAQRASTIDFDDDYWRTLEAEPPQID